MRTSKLALFYGLTQHEVIPPAQRELDRKEKWIEAVQGTVEADWKPKSIKVTYEVFNPEIEKQRRFFHIGVKFYAIQDMDMTEGEPDNEILKKYREEILDDLLGYDYQTVTRVIHSRKSTSEFKTAQKWYNLLKLFEEQHFDAAGYEFPESEAFWESVKSHGYEQANRIIIQGLQKRMIGRSKSPA